MPDDEFVMETPSASPVGRIADALRKHRGLLILLLLVAAVAYAYLYVIPRPSILTVSVMELDGVEADADVEIVSAGRTLKSGSTDAGSITFTNLPSKTPLSVRVDPSAYSPLLKSRSVEVELESGTGASRTVELERAYASSLALGDVTPRVVSIGAGCTPTFRLPVTNTGSSAVNVELTADDALKNVFTSNASVLLEGGASGTVDFTLAAGAKGASASGEVRIKHTRVGTDVSFTVVEAPKLSITPSEVRCPASGECTVPVTLQNNGKSPLTDLHVEVLGELVDYVTFISYEEGKSLAEGEKYIFFVSISAGGKGKVGKLRVSSSCPPPLEILINPGTSGG